MTKCQYQKGPPKNAYHYTMCGLNYIYLTNGYEIIQDPDFGESVIIHNADKLHTEIARNIVQYKEKLDSQELRFIRSLLDLTQKELAESLDVDLRTIQRWEDHKAEDLPQFAAESWIRIMFWDKYIGGNEKATEILKKIKQAREHYKSLCFTETQEEWKIAA